MSDGGGGYSWVDNSFFYRLTPWRNDPVTDQATEIVYLRDDETGEVWTPTPLPIRHGTPYTVRHAAGSTEFQHTHSGIATSLMLGMAGDDPVKIGLLTMTNETSQPRRLTITAFAEWVLGVSRELTRDNVVTMFNRDADAVFAACGEKLGDIRPAATLLVVAGLYRPEMKIEIEVTAKRRTA